jgi:hypothetical protein
VMFCSFRADTLSAYWLGAGWVSDPLVADFFC